MKLVKENNKSILFRGEIYTVTWEQNGTEPEMKSVLEMIKSHLDDLEKREDLVFGTGIDMVTIKQELPSDRESFNKRLMKRKRKEVTL